MDEDKTDAAGDAAGETAAEPTESVIDGMKVTTEEPEPCKMKFSVVVPEETVGREIEKKMRDVMKNAQIKGFRKGKVPRALIEKRFGKDIIEELKGDILKESLDKIIEDNNLRERVIGDPKFEPELKEISIARGAALIYAAEFEVKPVLELPKYRGIEVPKIDAAVTDEDVEKELKNLLRERGSIVPVEGRSLEPDDHAIVHIGVVAGDAEVSKHENLLIAPGREYLMDMKVERLHESLEGLNAGEQASVSVTFPEKPPEEMKIPESEAGKEGRLTLELVEIKEVKPAEITPEFLKQFDMDDEDELRARIRTSIEQRKTYQAEEDTNENIVKKLLEMTPVDVPPNLAKRLAVNAAMRQAYQLRMMGQDEDAVAGQIGEMMKMAEEPAAETIRRRFLLEAIADKEKIFALEEEVNGRIVELAAARGVQPQDLAADLQNNDEMESLRATVREEKALAFLRKHAKTVDAPSEEPKEEKKAGEAGEDKTENSGDNSGKPSTGDAQ